MKGDKDGASFANHPEAALKASIARSLLYTPSAAGCWWLILLKEDEDRTVGSIIISLPESWLTVEGEQKCFVLQLSGDFPLNDNKQKCGMLSNNKHGMDGTKSVQTCRLTVLTY